MKTPYRDKDTHEVHYAGETVEVTKKRYAEITKAGIVLEELKGAE